MAERRGFEPAFPRSLAPRGRCVSREAGPLEEPSRPGPVGCPSLDRRFPRPSSNGCWASMLHAFASRPASVSSKPGAGPLPGFLRPVAKQLAAGALKTTDDPPPFSSPSKDDLCWILRKRSLGGGARGFEPARPRSLAARGVSAAPFQGRPRFPGRVPRLALQPRERSLFARVLGAGLRRVPPFESPPKTASWGFLRRILAERRGFEPARPRSLAGVGVPPLAFQGRPRFPGRVPRLALQPCERSLFARVLGAGLRRVPPF